MNIKDFLMENYIYIIIVIILTIVTIIGFLADKKRNGDKKPKTMSGTISNNQNQNIGNMTYQQPVDLNQPINYQPMNNIQSNNQPNLSMMPNVGVTPNNTISSPLQMDNNMQQTNLSNVQPFNGVPFNNSPMDNQTVSPINNQPLDNQMATPINNPLPSTPNVPNQMNYNMPQPVEPLNQNINNVIEPIYQPLSEQKPTFAPVEPNINNLSTQNVNNSNVMTPNYVEQPNSQMMTNMPSPMEVPIQPNLQPQPVPMTMNQQPAAQPMPNTTGNTVPNPITPPQPVSPQQISFVYGQNGQNQNNNQFMQ